MIKIELDEEIKALIAEIKRELLKKNNIVLVLVMIVAFTGAGLFFNHFGAPECRERHREKVQIMLIEYYWTQPRWYTEKIMREFDFTDDDINPSKIFERSVEQENR